MTDRPARQLHLCRADLRKLSADVYILSTWQFSEGEGSAWLIWQALLERYQPGRLDELTERARAELQHGAIHHHGAQLLRTTLERSADAGQPPIRFVCINSVDHIAGVTMPARARLALQLSLDALDEQGRAPPAGGLSRPWVVATAGFRVGASGTVGIEFAQVFREAFAACEAGFAARHAELHVALWKESSFAACAGRFFPATPTSGNSPTQVIAQALQSRRCFLFIGSGLSFHSDPPQPSWQALFPSADEAWPAALQATRHELLAAKNHLPEVAQMIEDHKPNGLRREFIRKLHHHATPSVSHYQLMALPWRAIITTNYDTLIEDTLDAQRIPYYVARNDAELAALPLEDQVLVLKIHGGLKPGHDPGGDERIDIVATRDDYDRFFETRPGMAAFLESQLLTSTGVVVGYSLEDPHFRALFTRIGRIPRATPASDAGAAPPPPRVFFLTTEPPVLESYWVHRGIQPLVVPAYPECEAALSAGGVLTLRFRRFIAELAQEAEGLMARHRLPADFLKTLSASGLASWTPEQLATLVVLAGSHGAEIPKELLGRIPDRATLRRLASPEAYAQIVAAKKERRG